MVITPLVPYLPVVQLATPNHTQPGGGSRLSDTRNFIFSQKYIGRLAIAAPDITYLSNHFYDVLRPLSALESQPLA